MPIQVPSYELIEVLYTESDRVGVESNVSLIVFEEPLVIHRVFL